MAKKQESSEILVGLWDLVDQAGKDLTIKEAFSLIPQKDQIRFIGELIRGGQDFGNTDDEREIWSGLIARARAARFI